MSKTIIQLFIRLASIVAFFVLLVLSLLYFNTTYYTFEPGLPFSGNSIHNPYAELKNGRWLVGNFHAHADPWFGLTDGRGNNDDLYHAYINRLGYDVLGISNYMLIDNKCSDAYCVPTYEHGFGPTKNHQIVVGSESVLWLDYPFFQNRHQKQHILASLKERDNVIAIAHPKRGKAYSLEDMQYLGGYDCIEAFNHLSTSPEHWDAALSAGRPVYLMANDDSHNYEHIFENGRHATLVFTPDNSKSGIVDAMASGKSIAAEIYTHYTDDFKIHKNRVLSIEHLIELTVKNQEIELSFSDSCSVIQFIGQNGQVRDSINNVVAARYKFKKEDTYIRAVARFKNSGNIFYLNPVFRYDKELPVNTMPQIDSMKTVIHKIVVGLITLILFFLFFRNLLRLIKKPRFAS